MNVLSLFDGMSGGQIALKELGIIPDVYYASEIDKHAIAQTQLNFPNTIQLGSVTDVDISKLERIDLLLGGSPCQSFSFAGKRKGMATKCDIEVYTLKKYLQLKSDGFEFEGQSYLFWEYMRILTDIRKYNPEVKFLLENVEMGAKWERILSEAIGIYGVHINSNLVSAQNRRRIFWTNIKTREDGFFGELYSDIPKPIDRGILLKDILESDVDEKYYLSDKMLNYLTKNTKLQKENGNGFTFSITEDFNTKAKCITSKGGSRMDDNFILDSKNKRIRRLTPTECARLQTIPEWYRWQCSDTQQYRMLGNGWTIEVIKHILSFFKPKHMKTLKELSEMGKKPKFTFSITIETDDTDSGTCEVIIDLMDIDKNVLIPELITVIEFDFKIRDISKYTEEEIHSIYKELEEYKDKNYASLLDF